MTPKVKTRNQSGGIDPAIVFPSLTEFQNRSQLPTIKSVIGMLQSLTAARVSHDDAVREVSKLVYCKWFHDTVYCLQLVSIVRKMKKIWDVFREGRKRFASSQAGKAIEEYKKLVEDADKLFDVGAVTIEQKAKCKDDWNITMNEVEHRYYEDQKTVRRMECDKKVDPQWYYTVMRRERM